MTIKERISLECKNTVGYSEAINKDCFIAGANVGIIKTVRYYDTEVTNLKNELTLYKSMYECVNNDLNKLSSIINKYRDT